MRDRLIFTGQLLFTLLIAAFLIVPAALSMLAGVTANYFRGISSGFTLQWIVQVWDLYADTIGRSFLIAGRYAELASFSVFEEMASLPDLPWREVTPA